MVERTGKLELAPGWAPRTYHITHCHVGGGDLLFNLPKWGYLYRLSLHSEAPLPSDASVAVVIMPSQAYLIATSWEAGQDQWQWDDRDGDYIDAYCLLPDLVIEVKRLALPGKVSLRAEYVYPQVQAVESLG